MQSPAYHLGMLDLRLTPLRPKDWLYERLSRDELPKEVYNRKWEPRLAVKPSLYNPISQACTADQIYNTRYRQWVDEMHQPYVIHRKQWEWVYILQCLEKAGCLASGRRGLGFGVGTEPITAIAAKRGASVLATDSQADQAEADGWISTNQHAQDLGSLNVSDICDPEAFRERVKFRVVDMRDVPADLNGFDFTWSACALEHLGSLDAGFEFIQRSLQCLKPGGIAVHTTEYNLSSNTDTVDSGHTVLYRRSDLEALGKRLRQAGHQVKFTFGLGTTEDDRHIDKEPFTNCHLKVWFDNYVITSFGILIRRSDQR